MLSNRGVRSVKMVTNNVAASHRQCYEFHYDTGMPTLVWHVRWAYSWLAISSEARPLHQGTWIAQRSTSSFPIALVAKSYTIREQN